MMDYTITTILDGHKLHINPFSIHQQPISSYLILLDSTNSTFYTVQLPISQVSVFKRFSGNGSPGYEDGDVGLARFDKPRSFAVDFRGNVYVADRVNKVIRKISTNVIVQILFMLTLTTGVNADPMVRSTYTPPPSSASHSIWASPKTWYFLFGFAGFISSIAGLIVIVVKVFLWLRKRKARGAGAAPQPGATAAPQPGAAAVLYYIDYT